ncbi:hypothetical protein jhhlp_003518, partial [Lomentospora prolificans]
RITLNISNPVSDDQLLTLEVFPDMTVATLRDSIYRETQISPDSQHLYHNGNLITDTSRTMEQLQIKDHDLLALHVRDSRGTTGVPEPRRQVPRAPRPGQADPEYLRLQILGNPIMRQELQRKDPELALAVEDSQRFSQIFSQRVAREDQERYERQRLIQELNDDPFDREKQLKIEEMIRQERVMENLQSAMEYNPEVFGTVHMLYVDVEINGHKVKALVDSGAQATVMSPSCAEACGIMRLVDKRFSGIARGVGTANIIGRVHVTQIKIGSLFLPCSFTVMEGKAVDLLLGLDMLKRHQATLDLSRDKLIIQGQEVPFLGPADIPKEQEEALVEEPTVAGPAGTRIGQKSGAVKGPGEGGQSTAGASSAGASQVAGPPPAQQAAPQPQAPSGGATQAQASFSEDDIKTIVGLGFARQDAIVALQATDGNVDQAANLLFARTE